MRYKIKLINRKTKEVVQEVITDSPFPRTKADALFSNLSQKIVYTVEIEECHLNT